MIWIKKTGKKIFLIVVIALVILFCAAQYFSARYSKNENIIWGVSFSPDYTTYLGLDVKDTFRYILDDLKFRNLRLTARWDEIEKQKGIYDFSDLDYLMAEAGKRGAKVVLAVGQKTPRWPECNVPAWEKDLSDEEYFSALNNFVKKTAEHYVGNNALEIWQVENEPFFTFGADCHSLDNEKLQTEISVVKNIDGKHPVIITDSGELSLWRKTINATDLFGTTAYRVVWNKYTGYISYNWLPAAYFRWRALWHGSDTSRVYISELQAEPWMPDVAISDKNIPEQMKSMDLVQLRENLEFAKTTGFSRAYLWGAEWWYWLKIHGHSELSDYIQSLKKY